VDPEAVYRGKGNPENLSEVQEQEMAYSEGSFQSRLEEFSKREKFGKRHVK
jgi:hypothetical protein